MTLPMSTMARRTSNEELPKLAVLSSFHGPATMNTTDIGRLLLYLGLGLILLGGLVVLLGRVIDLGNLPGDLVYEGDNVRVYVPVATMIVLSLVLTLLLNLALRLFQ